MKKILTLGFILNLFCQNIFAQVSSNLTQSPMNAIMLQNMQKIVRDGKMIDNQIEGSPFLNDNFIEGKVITSNGTFEPVTLRYNIFQDVMEFEMERKIYYLEPGNQVKEVIMGEDTFVVKAYMRNNKPVFGYLKVLETGKLSLYQKKNRAFKEAQPPKALESEAHPARFIKESDEYFLEMNGDDLRLVKNAKEILAVNNKADLEARVKKAGISMKNENGMVKLVKMINEMN